MKNVMFLVVIADLYLGAKGKFTCICFQKTVDDLQHSSLAGSVVTDESYTFSALDIKGNIRKKCLSRECFGKLFYMENIIAA